MAVTGVCETHRNRIKTKRFMQVWGRSVNDFYIACDNGNVFHYQDQWLEPENLGAIQYDMFLWEDQIVSVGDNGIHQYNEIWTKLETGTDNALYGVWAFENKYLQLDAHQPNYCLKARFQKLTHLLFKFYRLRAEQFM
jgi:hypothetical protein